MELTIYNCISNFNPIHKFNTYLDNKEIEFNVINKNNYLYYSVYTRDEKKIDFYILELLQKLNI